MTAVELNDGLMTDEVLLAVVTSHAEEQSGLLLTEIVHPRT